MPFKNIPDQVEDLIKPKVDDVDTTGERTKGWIETIRKNNNRVPDDLYEEMVSSLAQNYGVSPQEARAAAYDWVHGLGFKFREDK